MYQFIADTWTTAPCPGWWWFCW